METTKYYQLPDIVLPGNDNLAAERKMITVTLDNKDRLIITRYRCQEIPCCRIDA